MTPRPATPAVRRPAPPAGRGRAFAALGLLLTAVLAASAQPPAKPNPVRLPDGTFLLPDGDGPPRVNLAPQELQKLQEQIDQLKKELAARKPVPPSGCALRVRVEKRGEQQVAAVVATYKVKTAGPAAVALGGRRAVLASAKADGRLPALDTADDGVTALVEAAGEHSLTLEFEAKVETRGAKGEVGFEIGLPRAAITTFALDPPGVGAKRVTVVARRDAAGPPSRWVRDAEQLTPRGGKPDPLAVGPAESLELTWEPPAAAPVAADPVLSADLDVTTRVSEAAVETVAKFRPKGAAAEWQLAAPASAEWAVERAAGAAKSGSSDPGPAAQLPARVPGKDAKDVRPLWAFAVPADTAAADWVLIATVRQQRVKAGDPKHKGPFPVGPFAVLNVVRQAGTVTVAAPPHSRITAKHGAELRQVEPPAGAEEEGAAAYFRLATGPTGTAVLPPLLTVEVGAQAGAVRVRPAYRLELVGGEWRVGATVHVVPFRTEVDSLAVEFPAEWTNREVLPPKLIEGTQGGKADGPRREVRVKLTAPQKEPFDFVIEATAARAAGVAGDAAVSLPRVVTAFDRDGTRPVRPDERDVTVDVTAPPGVTLRGGAREWDGDQPAAWAHPLPAAAGSDGKLPKGVSALAGRFDRGLARVDLGWQPYRPEMTADLRADVTVGDRQVRVEQRVVLRSPDGFGRPVRFRGPAGAVGVRTEPALRRVTEEGGPPEWELPAGSESAREAAVKIAFGLPAAGEAVTAGLFWPVGADRTEPTVRVWAPGKSVAATGGAWRPGPPDPDPDRDAWPALTPVGTGTELPLELDLRADPETGGTAVWVDRGLVEAWPGENGTVAYQARFRLARWRPGEPLELRLPPAAPGSEADVFLDTKRVDGVAVSADAAGRVLRVPVPDPQGGRAAVLLVRYRVAGGGPADEAVYTPPQLGRAAYSGPVRWAVMLPAGVAPVSVRTGNGTTEQRWRWRGVLPAPAPDATADDLNRWFRAGTEGDPATTDAAPGGGTLLVVRQPVPGPVRVFAVNRAVLVAGASAAVLVLGLLLSRLPGSAGGVVVALLAGALGAAAVYFPNAVSQAAAAAIPGAAALAVFAAAVGLLRWLHRRRAARLPGFTRTRPADTTGTPLSTSPSSGRNRPQLGSTGIAPLEVPSGSRG